MNRRNLLRTLDRKKLKLGLLCFFFALGVPAALLIQQAFSRLKWETFHQHQLQAHELAQLINRQFQQMVNIEEQRAVTDYAFLNLAGDPSANFIQRSPLSAFPVKAEIPGLIGYFQVDAEGRLLTPVVPEVPDKALQYGIPPGELIQRLALQDTIQRILKENRLVKHQDKNDAGAAWGDGKADLSLAESERESDRMKGESADKKNEMPSAEYPAEGQAVFDELAKAPPAQSPQPGQLGRVEELKLKRAFPDRADKPDMASAEAPAPARAQKQARTEKSILPETVNKAKSAAEPVMPKASPPGRKKLAPEIPAVRVRTFESEIDPFEFSQLDSGQFVLYRKVWQNGQRLIQGMMIESDGFLQHVINTAFRRTTLSQTSNLLVVYRGNVLSALSGRSPRGYLSSAQEIGEELLYQAPLSEPFNEVQLLFSVNRLPMGPGGALIIGLSLVLGGILMAGCYLLYRLGAKQIKLVEQQQDFVSAVSHELKTPLTSIRMYGEMLQAGWVDEQNKNTYYAFILDESERLTRLINNVLQLAGMTRNEKRPGLTKVSAAELMDAVRSKTSSQIERAGFALILKNEVVQETLCVKVNKDWFIQIVINLVDNALKFSAKSEQKIIEITCRRLSGDFIRFAVRDYGPGVPEAQLKKIFTLFYRAESELTRQTVGTGIGLALAHQMAVNMGGKIDVVNKNPGAEFNLTFSLDKGI